MKNIFMILLSVFLLLGCFEDAGEDDSFDSQVRFQNFFTDFAIPYGVKIGSAEWIGQFEPYEVTDYKGINTGSYSVQLLKENGDWITDSTGSFKIDKGYKYTLTINGNPDGYYYYNLIIDE